MKKASLVVVAAVCATCTTAQLLALQPAAFSRDECDEIVRSFRRMEREEDTRSNPLLPLMEGSFDVSRSNRYDDGTLRGAVEVILTRLLSSTELNSTFSKLTPRGATASTEAFSRLVDFSLLHEFNAGIHTRGFDWHVDTSPGDQTGRTLNVNVMLSESDSFTGGQLQVGDSPVEPRQGDAYVYAAATPHRVGPLTAGTRHTLVIALTERHSLQNSGSGSEHDTTPGSLLDADTYAQRRRTYWDSIEAGFERVLNGSLAGEPKVHILHGEHLEKQGRTAEAQAAFCRSYRASSSSSSVDDSENRRTTVTAEGTTAAAVSFAAEFFASGVRALGMGGDGAPEPVAESPKPDLDLAENYLAMAACVDPEHAEAAEALAVVREAKRLRDEAQSQTAG